jgi:lysyl-tRNA synthetase class 2
LTNPDDTGRDSSLRGPSSEANGSERQGRFERQRQEKLWRIKQLGIDPYGGRYEGAERACDIKSGFKDGDEKQRARCAGRIVLLRDIGKLIFITLRDWKQKTTGFQCVGMVACEAA